MVDPSETALVARLQGLAAGWDRTGDDDEAAFPADRVAALRDAGALRAFVSVAPGAATANLVAALVIIGGGDLGLGRIYEGHVNAAQLVASYGTTAQRSRLAAELAAGKLFGVWATEPAPGVTLSPTVDGWRLDGAKSFATGAGHLDRVLITVRRPDGAKQLVLADLTGEGARADVSGWAVRGMRGTCSGLFDFSGMTVDDAALIGLPDVYETEPRFSAGAWRFAAVQLGAVAALLHHVRAHLRASGKAEDPIQRARFAACVVAARSAHYWVAEAAQRAESAAPGAVAFVLMTRGVVEDAGHLVMEAAARGVGTAAFFTGTRIDRITRDLGLYLRQPVPDQARDRAAFAWLADDGADGLW